MQASAILLNTTTSTINGFNIITIIRYYLSFYYAFINTLISLF